eukprot:17592_1
MTKGEEQCDSTDAQARDQQIFESKDPKEWTSEDLIDLIRAVKFSHKDASIRIVHNEISTKMSQTPSFEFLQNVKLNDVKKVWKKAITGGNASASTIDTGKTGSGSKNEKSKKPSILKFYTVGDGSVKTLAEEYNMQAAAAAKAEISKEHEEELNKYTHCFLNVPADKSGTKPHQALINFNKKNRSSGAGKNVDGREIVKIQMAATIPGMPEKTPMLLYNFDRTAKTFIHPAQDGETSGYDKIRDLIIKDGVKGAISDGGTKAYFYCRITKRDVTEKDIVSVDITSGLAPPQRW